MHQISHYIAHWKPDMKRKPLTVITRTLTCAALIVVFFATTRTLASADPSPSGGDPQLFGGLSCSCSEAAPDGSPALKREIRRGIRQGLTVRQRD